MSSGSALAPLRALGAEAAAICSREKPSSSADHRSPRLLAASLVVLAEAARDPAATVEAARLWEEKGNLSALSTLDIEAQAR